MTREEFIKVLDNKKYSYKMKGDNIVVTRSGHVGLESLTSLPPGVEFNNKGIVGLESLTSLPPGVEFNNEGFVDLDSLKSLPPGVVFKNGGGVYLKSLTSLPPGVEFNNEGFVSLRSLVGGWFKDWKGNIEGVDSKKLLNVMISKGIFER